MDDNLSLALSRVGLESSVTCPFDLGGTWAIEFPRAHALRFKVILKGDCWLTVEGDGKRHHLEAGDCFLVSEGRSFVLSRYAKAGTKKSAEDLARTRRQDGVIVCDGGGQLLSLGAVFKFHGHFSKVIFHSLPPVLHIPARLDPAGVLRWSLDRFGAEFHGRGLGRAMMMNNLAPIILLQALRTYLGSNSDETSWLGALAQPSLSRALEAMHIEYEKDWTLESLARLSGMSRAGFALSFKRHVGTTPMGYLTSWRMQVACDLLQEGTLGLAEIARRTRYASESAFSAAFKKVVGVRPGLYRKSCNAVQRAQ